MVIRCLIQMRLNRFSERAFKNIKKEKDLMNKKIVVISTSMRANSNSEALAKVLQTVHQMKEMMWSLFR